MALRLHIRSAEKHQFAPLYLQAVSARVSPPTLPSSISELQRKLGNQRVTQLIQAKRLTPEGRILTLQSKLTVGAADDRYEQEADHVARRVMSMPDVQAASEGPPAILGEEDKEKALQTKTLATSTTPATTCLAASITPFAQRQTESTEEEDKETALQAKLENTALQRQPEMEEEKEEAEPIQAKPASALADSFDAGEDVESRLNQSKGGGSPLPDPVRAFMEPRFGTDFSDVRAHTGSDAVQMNRDVGAKAFTHGSDIYYGAGQSPGNLELTAHELTHVVQQTGGAPLRMKRLDKASFTSTKHGFKRIQFKCSECEKEMSHKPMEEGELRRSRKPAVHQAMEVIHRAGDPAAIPPGFDCPTDLTPGRPAGTDILFTVGSPAITAAHTLQLTTFRATWLAAGGTDDILVHGYASADGDQGPNWTLSCDRAKAVQAELQRLGIPAVRISVVAHGESTDFSTSKGPNRHAVVSTSSSILPLPLIGGVLTPSDNFTGRSRTRFGVGETIDLSFFSLPSRPAADFGGLQWNLAAGGGTLTGITNAGTATYTAPAAAGPVTLELQVAAGATAGRVISTHVITVVIPNGVNMVAVPGSAPGFIGGTAFPPISPGSWGAGFLADVFIDPKDVSFRGVVFGEGTIPAVVTPPGSFLSIFGAHPANTFGAAHGGNATTGTQVSPPQDQAAFTRAPARTVFGLPVCGTSDFLWAIPWEFSVAGGARTPFAVANQHATSTTFCDATVEKAGAGPFCRSIDGTTC